MERAQRKLLVLIMNLKNREDAILLYNQKSECIEELEEIDDMKAKKALVHITNLLTPEGYDDDICD